MIGHELQIHAMGMTYVSENDGIVVFGVFVLFLKNYLKLQTFYLNL
jgi:hypothetical protein